MNKLFSFLLILGLSGLTFAQDQAKVNGKRPFKESEPADVELLQNFINRKIGEITKRNGARMVPDPRIIKAANIVLRNPDIKDTTDSDGFHVPAVKTVLLKDGYNCGFVNDYYVEAKNICPTIRKFDASDTYENIATRFIMQMYESNKSMVNTAKTYGAGVYEYEDWERNENGPIYNEPKCTRIKVLFVFI